MGMNRCKGRVAIVTGAGTGIGATVAERLHREGTGVALIGRRIEPLQVAAGRCDGLALPADAASGMDTTRPPPCTARRLSGAASGPPNGAIPGTSFARRRDCPDNRYR